MDQELIRIQNVSKQYGRKLALNNVNLVLYSGKIVGLLGPNGSGKTTLIKILNGLIQNYQGNILINGYPVGKQSKSLISYLPDESYFHNWMRVKDGLALFRDMYEDFDEARCRDLLQRFGLNEDNMAIKTMSKGMKEKFQLCLVMSRRAKIYILDEPIAGVDPAARDFIMDVILKNYDPQALILLSTHLISDLENVFDEIIFLKEGVIVMHDQAENIRRNYDKSIDEVFREVFRC